MRLSLLLLLLATIAYASHGGWMDAYRDADGIRCCGQLDCLPTHARVLAQTADVATVEVDGLVVAIPAKALHASETNEDYWCARRTDRPLSQDNIRCVFIAVGS